MNKKRERLEEPAVVVGPLTAATLEDWHKNIAAAGGLLSLTIARRKRSPQLAATLLGLLSPVVEELKKHA